MPASFTRRNTKNIGSVATKVGNFTASNPTAMLTLTLSNTSNSEITTSVYHNQSHNANANTYWGKYIPIPVGGAVVMSKKILVANDSVYVVSSASNSLDASMDLMIDS